MLKYAFVMTGLLMLTCGCGELAPSSNIPASPAPKAGATKPALAATDAKPTPSPESETAVDQALDWAKRFDQANQKATRLESEKTDLARKNQELADQVTKARGENEQLTRELNDANTMLVDLRKELDRWRTNVLGFRQEMREAQQTQLEALAKIMKMLGGEMNLPPSSGPTSATAKPPSGDTAVTRPADEGAPQP